MHVVVLGAGYAGLTLTRSLEDRLPPEVELTLVDASPDHLVQHELHRVIRRPELANEIVASLPSVLDRATVRVTAVEEIDRASRTIGCSDGRLSYDVAAICLGARTAYYGLEGVREHAIPLKRLSHAFRIRRAFYDAIDRDRRSGGSGNGSREDCPRIVVGGAGLSGVQVAGELAALAREESLAVGDGSASIDDAPAAVEIVILEQFESVAPNFPANFQRAVADALSEYGIDVRTGATVAGADEEAVHLEDGGRLPYDVFVWTGGIRGSDALGGDRPAVRGDLRLDDRTFVLGDAARVVDVDGEAVPASAQSAVREARTAAKNVSRLVESLRGEGSRTDEGAFGPRLEQFDFESPGWIVSVGDDAVAQVGPTVLTGKAAKALKATVGVGYLSSVGGVKNAIDLAGSELGLGR